jgi:maltodextrin utilization protein YvdJ
MYQCERIWRIFAYLAIAYFRYLKITDVVHILGVALSHGESFALFFTKMGWATLWAIFSETHLVTLACAYVPMHVHTYAQALLVFTSANYVQNCRV